MTDLEFGFTPNVKVIQHRHEYTATFITYINIQQTHTSWGPKASKTEG